MIVHVYSGLGMDVRRASEASVPSFGKPSQAYGVPLSRLRQRRYLPCAFSQLP